MMDDHNLLYYDALKIGPTPDFQSFLLLYPFCRQQLKLSHPFYYFSTQSPSLTPFFLCK